MKKDTDLFKRSFATAVGVWIAIAIFVFVAGTAIWLTAMLLGGFAFAYVYKGTLALASIFSIIAFLITLGTIRVRRQDVMDALASGKRMTCLEIRKDIEAQYGCEDSFFRGAEFGETYRILDKLIEEGMVLRSSRELSEIERKFIVVSPDEYRIRVCELNLRIDDLSLHGYLQSLARSFPAYYGALLAIYDAGSQADRDTGFLHVDFAPFPAFIAYLGQNDNIYELSVGLHVRHILHALGYPPVNIVIHYEGEREGIEFKHAP